MDAEKRRFGEHFSNLAFAREVHDYNSAWVGWRERAKQSAVVASTSAAGDDAKLDQQIIAAALWAGADEDDDGTFLCYRFQFPVLRAFVKAMAAHTSGVTADAQQVKPQAGADADQA